MHWPAYLPAYRAALLNQPARAVPTHARAACPSCPSCLPAPYRCLQFGQWSKDLGFRLFDYGSKAANRRHYGADRPPSMAGEHWRRRVAAWLLQNACPAQRGWQACAFKALLAESFLCCGATYTFCIPPALCPLPLPAENYRLLDVPVDLLAGAADGVIPPACVLQHVHHLRAAGVPCSFRILPFGHLDFTLGVKEDIRGFVLSKLRRPL